MSQKTVLLISDNWDAEATLVVALVRAYATSFWGGTWKELLAVRDADGRVLRQFGTFDESGEVFPETRELLTREGISTHNRDWPMRLWELASAGLLQADTGEQIDPYWSLESAEHELRTFVTKGTGYGGEILMLVESGEIVGFTAYACARGDDGRAVAHRRFPTQALYVPIDNLSPSRLSVRELLELQFSGDRAFGIFLDHAVSEVYRGNGLGSRLFDARLDRLLELGTDITFGRTMVTAPRQYVGNYLARGLRPIAADGTDAFSRAKHYFAADRCELHPRSRT